MVNYLPSYPFRNSNRRKKIMTNALNNMNMNFNQAAATSQEEKETKKNNVFLNLKVTTKSGDVRNFSFLLRTSGSGFEQSNANNIIANAVSKSATSLEEANKYLTEIFADPEKWNPTTKDGVRRIVGECYLSGIKSASKDWVNDF
jgi:hypothetical protein